VTTQTLDPEALALAERAYGLLAPFLPERPADAPLPTNVLEDDYLRFAVTLWDVISDYALAEPGDLAAMLLRYRAELEGRE